METDTESERAILRTRDFWSSLVLIGLSLFFLWKTSHIPLFGGNRAGVSGADWYTSAAIVPLGIFGGMLVLALMLLATAIREGGAARALSAIGIGWDRAEALRFATIAAILFFYVASLVPRVDFILGSGLLITALIGGYRGGEPRRMLTAMGLVAIPGLYALLMHLPQAQWGAHDDDWVTLACWIAATIWVLRLSRGDRVLRAVPWIALLAPFILITAMAFGFRQNVPNRGGAAVRAHPVSLLRHVTAALEGLTWISF